MIKQIAVHLTGSPEDAKRLEYAGRLASLLEAHITGLQVHQLPSILSITDPSGSSFLQQLIDKSTKEADAVSGKLSELLSEFGLPADLRRLDVFPEDAGRTLADEVRVTDLFVGTQPYGDPERSHAIEEAVLFRSGRPCLFLPAKFGKEARLNSIVVGWKNAPEAARAVFEALPLLQKAAFVDVIVVSEESAVQGAGIDFGKYLSRHGVRAEIRAVPGRAEPAMVLLGEARAITADLIVIGAYGHSRMRELILGGTTRDVLKNSPIPVFMAH
jgi:nucleotide-binding universal stress UspA family protein